MKKFIYIIPILILLVGYFLYSQEIGNETEQASDLEELDIRNDVPQEDYEIIAGNLEIPWELVFLPNQEILVTQRPGTLLLLQEGQQITIDGVEHIGEGGLLGMALHPDFEQNNWLYLYLTTRISQTITNRVERYQFINNSLSDREIILDNIPGAANHNGGRIAFSPDGYLFITTGDAQNPDLAQDINSLAGKILRINDDGSIPADNPFNNEVYSYGHRNAQGLAWDNQNRLWATEHGRSGVLSGMDELNLIEMGNNYGWPAIEGDQEQEGMETPVIHSGPDITWAPAGATFFDGSIFFAGLRGSTLYEYVIDSGELREHFQNEFGRLRAVVLGPGNNLYITTSNTDGRGIPEEKDDKVIKITL
jgi:glucose/arabinose dehydrogenase